MERNVVCSVQGCYTTRRPDICFFSYPTNAVRRSQWLRFSRETKPINSNTKICSRHFAEEHKKGTGKLKRTAVPTLHPSHKLSYTPHQSDVTIPHSNNPVCSVVENSSEISDHEEDILIDASIDINHEIHITEHSEKLLILPTEPQAPKVRIELCRVCGTKGSSLLSVFEVPSDDAGSVSLPMKIEMYLSLKMSADDPLPSLICSKCHEILNLWHDLNVTCLATNAILETTLSAQHCKVFRNTSQSCSSPNRYSVVEECDSQCVHVERDHDYHVLQKDHATEEKNRQIFFVKRKKTKSVEIQVDDSSWDELSNSEFKQNIKLGDLNYFCKYCRELFHSSESRRNHTAVCRESSTLCEECGKMISHKKYVRNHKNRHQGEKKVMCDKCGNCFCDSSLKGHMESKHNTESTPKFYCEPCCKVFPCESYYNIHKRNHEDQKIKSVFKIDSVLQDGKSVYICPVCQQKFNEKLSLIVHLTAKKPMKCPTCRNPLLSERGFLSHTCKKWQCRYCSKFFYKKMIWRNHERVHTGEKPYQCRVCDVKFTTLSGKIKHQRKHENTVFECTVCGKKFKSKECFKIHMKVHNGIFISCPVCHKKFVRKRVFDKHWQKLHGNDEQVQHIV